MGDVSSEQVNEQGVNPDKHTTLHEGDLVRSVNGLYERYGIGKVTAVRGDQAKVEFTPSVFMNPPYRSEVKILAAKELEKIDTPISRLQSGTFDDPQKFWLKVQAARFLTGNKGGQLSNARTEILPHQIFAAHKIVSSAHRRFLLADDVGLGKTIECGMVWQALHQRGQANRTLIVCPAGLTTQWQEEMQDKFGELFEIFGRDFMAVNPQIWDLKAKAIASLDTLKRKEHRQVLLENRNWDLIIFDEAHRLSARTYDSGRKDYTQNYRLAEDLKGYTDALLLVTATPHKGDESHSQFRMLMRLLDDDIDFSGLEQGLFAAIGHGGKPYYELVIRTPKRQVTDGNGQKVFNERKTTRLQSAMYADEKQFYKEVEEYIRKGYKLLERETNNKIKMAGGFLLTTFQKLNASSTAAIRSALSKRLERLKLDTSSYCPVTGEPEDLWEDERFEGEQDESKRLDEKLGVLGDHVLQQGETDQLESLLKLEVKRDKKLTEMLKLLDRIDEEAPRQAEERVLIFTEYRKTQEFIVRNLEEKYGKGSVVVIHGGMPLEYPKEDQKDIDVLWQPILKDGAIGTPTTKRRTQRLFRDHAKARFLVSTEAGGEGINLQFCHICINYDLPWNPMRVEQRVGRIYRYGQKKVVMIYNFFNRDTIEDKVQSFFERKLKTAAKALAKVSGENVDEIMVTLNGQLENEIEPSKVYKRALLDGNIGQQTNEEISAAVKKAKVAYEIATQSLFRDVSSFSFDTYKRELATDLTLDDLKYYARNFLTHHRRQVVESEGVVEFLVPKEMKERGLPERYLNATFDRQLAIRNQGLQFLALGHPFITSALKTAGSYDFGGLTSAIKVEGTDAAGLKGYLCIFIVQERVVREDGYESTFHFRPVFIDNENNLQDAGLKALELSAKWQANEQYQTTGAEAEIALAAREHVLESNKDIWEEDIEFLAMAWCEFV